MVRWCQLQKGTDIVIVRSLRAGRVRGWKKGDDDPSSKNVMSSDSKWGKTAMGRSGISSSSQMHISIFEVQYTRFVH